MNADKIKMALSRLHLAQAGGLSTIKAYNMAITGSGLTWDECNVLRRAVNLPELDQEPLHETERPSTWMQRDRSAS